MGFHFVQKIQGIMAVLVVVVNKNYFAVLRLPIAFDIKEDDLLKAYFSLQKLHHPDKSNVDDSSSSNINEAYNVLKNQISRAEHIMQLNGYNNTQNDLCSAEFFAIHEMMSENSSCTDAIKRDLEKMLCDIEKKLNDLFSSGITNDTSDDILKKINEAKIITKMIERCSI